MAREQQRRQQGAHAAVAERQQVADEGGDEDEHRQQDRHRPSSRSPNRSARIRHSSSPAALRRHVSPGPRYGPPAPGRCFPRRRFPIIRQRAMPQVLILTEVQESMRARYKARLLELFPQLTVNVVGHHSKVDPYIADTDILLCFSPPMADHVVRDAPKLKWIQALGTGVDNIVDLPSLATGGAGHQYPRHPRRRRCRRRRIAYMLSLARDMPRVGARAGQERLGALAGAADGRQDRRHSRRRRDRRASGADVQGLQHDGGRHQLRPAREPRASTAWCDRDDLVKVARRARLPGGADPAQRRDPQHRRREAARRHEADRLS